MLNYYKDVSFLDSSEVVNSTKGNHFSPKSYSYPLNINPKDGLNFDEMGFSTSNNDNIQTNLVNS